VIGGGGPAGTLAFDEHFLTSRDRPEVDLTGRCLDPDEPFLILFTSGTTGAPSHLAGPCRLELIEAMPRTAMGKIRKADLRKHLEATSPCRRNGL
jgi:acyl-coenzyme A synthetase/AMP-(fatty) acid ligase